MNSSILINGVTLIALSLAAVPSLFLDKNPKGKEIMDKILPYQGWAGVVFCIWGIWGIISLVFKLGWLGDGIWGIISWVTWLLYAVLETTLGFILGYNLIVKYALSKNEAAKAKGEQLLGKLVPMQGKLGIVGLCLGVWCIIAAILFA